MNKNTEMYKTWLLKGQALYIRFIDLIQETPDDEDEERAAQRIAEEMERYTDEHNPLKDTDSVYSDLLSMALYEVDFFTLALDELQDHRSGHD